ncbi:kinase-like domain-containing protein [Gorgonomyces haynaldii]|nr:kinase-like domain-containing protein [Gorgonomyces haynaldii]
MTFEGLQKYTIQQTLAKTHSGYILRSDRVCIKAISKSKIPFQDWCRDRKLGSVTREVYILSRLEHPGIIKFVETLQDHDFFYICMEYHGEQETAYPSPPPENYFKSLPRRRLSCDLFEYISAESMSESRIRYIYRQIVDAVAYLHDNGVCHLDIKDENVVIDDNLVTKLIDFGSSNFIPTKTQDYFLHYRGTRAYTPPEVLDNLPFRGPEVDVWSLGVLLFIMAYGFPPFSQIEHVRHLVITKPPFKRSDLLNELILDILQLDPLKRPTCRDILSHEWFWYS